MSVTGDGKTSADFRAGADGKGATFSVLQAILGGVTHLIGGYLYARSYSPANGETITGTTGYTELPYSGMEVFTISPSVPDPVPELALIQLPAVLGFGGAGLCWRRRRAG